MLIWSNTFFRISSKVLLPAYQMELLVEPLKGESTVEAKSNIALIVIGDDGNAPERTPSVDGRPPRQVAVPVVVLSTIGQMAVVSILNVPRWLCDKKFEGGLILLRAVLVHPGPLNQTSRAVPNICAFNILFILVAEAPLRMLDTYVARLEQLVGALLNGP